jgi:hypothetical protein
MKKKLFNLAGIILILCYSVKLPAQTAGTLTFTYNQPQPTAPAPNAGIKNVLAVWIENSAGVFIKTKYRFVSGSTSDHLPTWAVKSGGTLSNATATTCNTTDAITGATCTATTTTAGTLPAGSTRPTAFGSKTITWDAKNVSGTANGAVVPDGVYNVWVESSWVDSGSNNHGTIISFPFTKGPTPVNITPAGNTYINTVSLVWTPSPLGINDYSVGNLDVNVYPNPSNGFINLDFNSEVNNIKVTNLLGQEVYNEKINQLTIGTTKSIDLSKFQNGIYIVNVSNENGGNSNYKVILDK